MNYVIEERESETSRIYRQRIDGQMINCESEEKLLAAEEEDILTERRVTFLQAHTCQSHVCVCSLTHKYNNFYKYI